MAAFCRFYGCTYEQVRAMPLDVFNEFVAFMADGVDGAEEWDG